MEDEDQATPFPECVVCTAKTCERTPILKLEVCQFGISHVNDGAKIQKRNASITLSHLSQNLRHELHKILQLIVNEASIIDKTVSARNISISNPAGRIVAATTMLDNIIEMISGVNDFRPGFARAQADAKPTPIARIIEKYDRIYSLVKNPARPTEFRLNINIPATQQIIFATSIVEYLIAVLVDNARKYSLVEIDVVRAHTIEHDSGGMVDLILENPSKEIVDTNKIFSKGYQQDESSEGFGFGLFWAKVLIHHYNQLLDGCEHDLELQHEQEYIDIDNGICLQRFTIKNLRILTT